MDPWRFGVMLLVGLAAAATLWLLVLWVLAEKLP